MSGNVHPENVPPASADLHVALPQQLRSYLQKRLPEHMLPATFVVLDALPITASGKVDYLALPAPVQDSSQAHPNFIAPRTDVEKALADIWTQALTVEQVGMEDNFFLLGGHSLLVIQVVARIRESLQVELSLRLFFETPTIAALAKYIETLRWTTRKILSSPDGLTPEREGEEI